MNPNERDTNPPSPDATAHEPEWVDPWAWRAYPDEPAAPDEPEEAEATDGAGEGPAPAPKAEAPAAPAEPATAEPPSDHAVDQPDPAEPDEPTESPEPPEAALVVLPPEPEGAADADLGGAAEPAEAPGEAAEAAEPAEDTEPAGPPEPELAEEPGEGGGEAEEAEERGVGEERPAAGEPVAEEPGAEPEGGEPVGPSDWDERVQLLERVESREPADFREPGDFWDLGDLADERAPEEAWEPLGDGAADPAHPTPAEPPAEPPRPVGPPRALEPPRALVAPPWLPGPAEEPRAAPTGPAGPRSLPPRPAPSGGWGPPAGLESPWGLPRAPAPARPARTRRRGWIIALAIVVALAVMAVQLVQLGVLRRTEPATSSRGAQVAAPNAPAPRGPGASASTLSPQAQVVRLLASRSEALLRHDKAAFLATVDRGRGGFYRSQAALFDRMATVPFASFSYSVSDPLQDVGSDRARQKYRPTAVSMFPVEASFGFRGQDASPFVAHYFYTFAVTDSGWRIAGQDDVPKPLQSDVEIWDAGPVRTVSSSRTLVVFHPGDVGLARRLLTVAERGYTQVAASWSANWDRKVVILVPKDQREAQRLVRSRDLSDVAAVTSSAIEAGPLHRLLGNRIIVNTGVVDDYRTLDLQVVLTHEMTHVATRGIGVGVPLYLVEGFADYTALRPLDAPVRLTRPSLALAVRAGRFKGKLPSRSQLVGRDAALAYDEGSTFCLWVVSTFGEAKLQALYSSFGDLTGDADRRDEDLRFRRVLGVSRATAEARWAAFVRGVV